MGWYFVITEDMRALGLKGNELLVFAVINGYSQGEQGVFYGSLSRLAEMCGVTKMTVINVLKSLIEKGFIRKAEQTFNNVKTVTYSVEYKNFTTGINFTECGKNFDESGINFLPNNKVYNKDIYKDTLSTARTREVFVKPSVEDVRAYCAEKSLTVDAEAFVNFYESNGWKVGKNPMKSWRAAVCTWAHREATEAHSAPRQPKKVESYWEHNMKIIENINKRKNGQL